jgi:Crinkler effector protein N-terminal domain
MSDQFKLFCWVLDISHRPFPVNIRKSETVGDLAKAIILAKPHTFKHVEADTLILWKASDLSLQLILRSMLTVSTSARFSSRQQVSRRN